MKKAFIISFLIFIFSINFSFSQNQFTLPEITRPSPTVAQLMKFEEVDLSHYTGQPNIAIPLFSKNIHGLNYNLALQYQVSGIRVDEQSGWVGKGWALETGGVISRSVVGLPDNIDLRFFSDGYYGTDYNGFHDLWDLDGSFWVDDPATGTNSINTNNFELYPDINTYLPIVDSDAYKIREFYFNALWAKQYKTDYQRDIYQFNFFGHTGRFIFIKDDNNLLTPKIIGNDSKLKIESFYVDVTTVIAGTIAYPRVIDYFTITNENGFVFTFDQIEETTNSKYTIINPQQSSGGIAPNAQNIPIPKFRSAWKLSNVVSPQGTTLIDIFYNSNPIIENPKTPNTRIENNLAFHGQIASAIDECDREQIHAALLPRFITTLNNITIDSKKVTQITFADGVSINFDFTLDHPEYNGAQLNNIQIYNPFNVVNKSFAFEYNPLMRSGDENYQNTNHQLLFLDAIKVNQSNIHKYTFDYGDKVENLKAYGTNLKDDFGYYKSNDVINYKEDVTSGALKSITYPTGGKRQFNWESNTYSYKGKNLLSFDEIFENPDNYQDTTDSQIHESIRENLGQFSQSGAQYINVNMTQNVNVKYEIIAGQQAIEESNLAIFYVPLAETYNNSIHDYHDYIIGEPLSFLLDGSNNFGSQNLYLSSGKYVFYILENQLAIPTEFPDTAATVRLRLRITTRNLNAGPLNWWQYGGGLRIASIGDIDKDDTKVETIFNYALEPQVVYFHGHEVFTHQTPSDYPGVTGVIGANPNPVHNFSSGIYDGELNLNRKYRVNVRPIIMASGIVMNPISYNVIEHQNELNAQLTQGSFIGFKNVAEYKNNFLPSFQNGTVVINKSVAKHAFTSTLDDEYIIDPFSYIYPFIPSDDQDYLRGNLRSTKLYNEDNNIVKQISNIYNFDNEDIRQSQAKSIHFVIDENQLAFPSANFLPVIYFTGNAAPPISALNFSSITDAAGALSNVIRNSYRNFDDFFVNDSNNYSSSPCDVSGTIEGFLENFTAPRDLLTKSILEELTVNRQYLIDEYSYKVQLTSSETKDYYYDGTEAINPITNAVIPDKIVESRQEFEYYPENYQIKEQNTYSTVNGIEEHLQAKYSYPGLGSLSGLSLSTTLVGQNRINEVVGTESFKNGKRIATVLNIYKNFDDQGDPQSSNDLVLPEKIQFQKNEPEPPADGGFFSPYSDLEDRIKYHDYDDYGNPLEVSKADGTHIVYIWGYHKTQPIAKIENATYSQVSNQVANLQTKSNADNDRTAGTSGNEGLLRQALTTLRNSLPNAMVTTFTYDPLIGVTSITDPRGNVIYYHYDNFNRLEHVKDKDGNILSKNDYNYRTQN